MLYKCNIKEINKKKIIIISLIAIVIYTACVVVITLGTYKNAQKKNIDKLVKDVTKIVGNRTSNVIQEEEDTTDYKEFKDNMKDMLDNIKKNSNN